MTLEEARDEASGYLDNIRAFFKSGVRLSLFVRTSGSPDIDFMLTDDDLREIDKMIKRRDVAKGLIHDKSHI